MTRTTETAPVLGPTRRGRHRPMAVFCLLVGLSLVLSCAWGCRRTPGDEAESDEAESAGPTEPGERTEAPAQPVEAAGDETGEGESTAHPRALGPSPQLTGGDRQALTDCVGLLLTLHQAPPESRATAAAEACAPLVADAACREAMLRREGVLSTCTASYCPQLEPPRPAICRPDTEASIPAMLPFALAILRHDLGDFDIPEWVAREYGAIFGPSTPVDQVQARFAAFLERLGQLDLTPDQRLVLGASMGLALSFPTVITVEVDVPHTAPSATSPAPRPRVLLGTDGFHLSSTNAVELGTLGEPAPGCADDGPDAATICLRSDVVSSAPLSDRLDYAALYNSLVRIRLHPDWHSAFGSDSSPAIELAVASSDLPFECVVKTMDVARHFLDPRGGAAPSPEPATLEQYLLPEGMAWEDASPLLTESGEPAPLFPNVVLVTQSE